MTNQTCQAHQLRNNPDGVLLAGKFIQHIRLWLITLTKSVSQFHNKLSISLIIERCRQWHRNQHTRQQLAEMSDYQLKDIGLDRCMVDNEISKPFWRD